PSWRPVSPSRTTPTSPSSASATASALTSCAPHSSRPVSTFPRPRAPSTCGCLRPAATPGRSPSVWPWRRASSCHRASSTVRTAPATCGSRSSNPRPAWRWPLGVCGEAFFLAESVVPEPLLGQGVGVLLVDVGLLVHGYEIAGGELGRDRVPEVLDFVVELRRAEDGQNVVG